MWNNVLVKEKTHVCSVDYILKKRKTRLPAPPFQHFISCANIHILIKLTFLWNRSFYFTVDSKTSNLIFYLS